MAEIKVRSEYNMVNNRITHLGAPITGSDAARWSDVLAGDLASHNELASITAAGLVNSIQGLNGVVSVSGVNGIGVTIVGNTILLSGSPFTGITSAEVAGLTGSLQTQIDSINVVGSTGIAVVESPGNTFTVSLTGSVAPLKFDFASPSGTWYLNHGRGYRSDVTVFIDDEVTMAQVKQPTVNEVYVLFNSSEVGYIILD